MLNSKSRDLVKPTPFKRTKKKKNLIEKFEEELSENLLNLTVEAEKHLADQPFESILKLPIRTYRNRESAVNNGAQSGGNPEHDSTATRYYDR